MVKRRPAIIVSPRLPYRDGLCTVVPLSTTAPKRALPYVVEVSLDRPLPAPFDGDRAWAKCDMLSTVCFGRLDLFRDGKDQYGKRKYLKIMLNSDAFEEVRRGVLAGLGIVT